MNTKIILVEDDPDITDLIMLQGKLAGYCLLSASNGDEGLRLIEKELPDLVILDLMLPGKNGLDICRKMKTTPALKDISVIILSAKSEELDVVLGLELGADDYVAKPFSPKILFSRVRAVLRRGKENDDKEAPERIVFGVFRLELENYQLFKKDKPIPLTLTEFSLLRRMLTNRGKVLSRDQLLDEVPSSADTYIVDRNIDVHIASLRRKLGPNFTAIETVRGVGYRFREED